MTMNKVILVGNLGADPEVRYTQNGDAVCNLRIATHERVKDREGNWGDRTEWHRVVVFGNQAEKCREYLRKGRSVAIEGSLQTREWQDRDGNKRYTTEVKAFRVHFLGGREGGGGGGYGGGGGGGGGGSGGGGGYSDGPGDDGFYGDPQGGGGGRQGGGGGGDAGRQGGGGDGDGGRQGGGGGGPQGGNDPGLDPDDDIPF